MAYLALIVSLFGLMFFIQEVSNQIKTKVFNPRNLILKGFLLFVCVIASNYLNNKYLAELRAKPYVNTFESKVYSTDLQNIQLKPLMQTEERQKRTDGLINRKQITDKLYD